MELHSVLKDGLIGTPYPHDPTMLKIIVFSHNRAAQCELTLTSVFDRFQTHLPVSINVLYTTTDESFERGYSRLRSQFSSRGVEFLRVQKDAMHRRAYFDIDNLAHILSNKQLRENGNNFKELTEKALAAPEIEVVLFLSDECVFYKPLLITPEILNLLAKGGGNTAFTTRLGLNVQRKPLSLRDQTRYCQWYADKAVDAWSERFNVLGNIYNAASLRLFLQPLYYNSMKTLQQYGAERAEKLDAWNTQYCFHTQRLVELSIDDVHVASQRELNEQCIRGNTLRIPVTGYINGVSINVRNVNFEHDPQQLLQSIPSEQPDYGNHSGVGHYHVVVGSRISARQSPL